MTRVIVILLLGTSLAVAQCSTSNISVAQERLKTAPKPIREFAEDLAQHGFEGYTRDEVLLPLAEKRFGSPVRSVGSGIIRFQWELFGGTLTVGGGEAMFDKDRERIWLIPDRTRLLTGIRGHFEMTTLPKGRMMYWLGDVYLRRDGTYKLVDSGPEFAKQRSQKKSNFLIAHPKGIYILQYARGCEPTTMLQNQPDNTHVGVVMFATNDGRDKISFSVVYLESRRGLTLRSKLPLKYKFLE